MAKMLIVSYLNCVFFGWEQPEDESSLLNCTKCKMAFYCSRQCQEEHWLNVHKKHCRYLSKAKVLTKAKHDEATCLVCEKETTTGKLQMCKPDNPVLPCILAQANQELMKTTMNIGSYAFPLAEMSGQFLTKIEETVTIMMRILTKLKMTKHTACCIDTTSAEELYLVLGVVRNLCWAVYFIILHDDGIRMNQTLLSIISSIRANKIIKLVKTIDYLLGAVLHFEDSNMLRPWYTLKVLSNLLVGSGVNLGRTLAESIGLPPLSKDLLRVRVTAAQFIEMRKSVLRKLQAGMAPFSSVLESLCGDSLEQLCFSCNDKVTVGNVVNHLGFFNEPDAASVLFFHNTVILSLCDKTKCRKRYDKIVEEQRKLELFYAKIVFEYSEEICDFCDQFYAGERIHRCSRCLTKVYFGEDCRDKAWPVHKLAWRKGEEKRKVKACKEERKQIGSKNFEIIM